MSIKLNKENVNEYYKKVNDIIKKYLTFGVHPENIKTYFKKGGKQVQNLIEKNNLADVENIERVVLDVVEDTYNMHSESIKTFEKFLHEIDKSFIPDILFKTHPLGSGVAERTVADVTKVSMGYLENDETVLTPSKKSRVVVNTNNSAKYFVFSKHDFNGIIQRLSTNIVGYLIVDATINIPVLNVDIPIRTLDIDNSKAIENIIEFLINNPTFNQVKMITNLLNAETGEEIEFIGKTNSELYVWQVK